jgi:hypothetical protein
MYIDHMQVWLLIVTDGLAIEFPPEIYLSEREANRGGEFWSWVLSGPDRSEVDLPFPGRWQVGFRDIRLSTCEVDDLDVGVGWWAGIHWTSHGFPDPEGVVLRGRDDARAWCIAPLDGDPPDSVRESDWMIEAEFPGHDVPETSVVARAKVVRFASTEDRGAASARYVVQLTATFVHNIQTTIKGSPGLEQEEIERLIAADWPNISQETGVLLESSWELESFVGSG